MTQTTDILVIGAGALLQIEIAALFQPLSALPPLFSQPAFSRVAAHSLLLPEAFTRSLTGLKVSRRNIIQFANARASVGQAKAALPCCNCDHSKRQSEP